MAVLTRDCTRAAWWVRRVPWSPPWTRSPAIALERVAQCSASSPSIYTITKSRPTLRQGPSCTPRAHQRIITGRAAPRRTITTAAAGVWLQWRSFGPGERLPDKRPPPLLQASGSLQGKDMITQHQITLHLIRDSTDVPNNLPQSEHSPQTITTAAAGVWLQWRGFGPGELQKRTNIQETVSSAAGVWLQWRGFGPGEHVQRPTPGGPLAHYDQCMPLVWLQWRGFGPGRH